MIRATRNPSGEADFRFQLQNGWTVTILCNPDGTAIVAAWPSHEPEAAHGQLKLCDLNCTADDAVEFAATIAAKPPIPETVHG